jgi:nitrate reductase gamma subunit
VSDLILFAVFPYVATLFAVGGVLYRFRYLRHTVTARSSQLLESRALYWGSVPWHVGILPILLAHLLAAVFPGTWGRLLGSPSRLYVLEVTGLVLGALTVVGMAVLLVRRASLLRHSHPLDLVAMAALAVQIVTVLQIALTLRWGSGWYLHTAAPWLLSLVKLDPRIDAMVALPLVVKLHAVNAFVLAALVPVTRLVHAVTFPFSYLGRPPQLVLWRRSPGQEVSR